MFVHNTMSLDGSTGDRFVFSVSCASSHQHSDTASPFACSLDRSHNMDNSGAQEATSDDVGALESVVGQPTPFIAKDVEFASISINNSDFKAYCTTNLFDMNAFKLLETLKNDFIFRNALKRLDLHKAETWIFLCSSKTKDGAADSSNIVLLEEGVPIRSAIRDCVLAPRDGSIHVGIMVDAPLAPCDASVDESLRLEAARAKFRALIHSHNKYYHVDDAVLHHLCHDFSEDMASVFRLNCGLSATVLYERASTLPDADCKAFLKRWGYNVTKPLDTHSKVFVAIYDTEKQLGKLLHPEGLPSVLHIAAACGISASGDTAVFKCNAEICAEYPATLMPFKIIKYLSKHIMLMPCYSLTLQELDRITPALADVLYKDIVAALSWLHSKGLAHCDLKPANVCGRGVKGFSLIDLGSVACIGDPVPSTTLEYVPLDLHHTTLVASTALDYWMLGMLLWDVLGMPDYGSALPDPPAAAPDRPHLSKRRIKMSRARLWLCLSKDAENGVLAAETWRDFSERLKLAPGAEEFEKVMAEVHTLSLENPSSELAPYY